MEKIKVQNVKTGKVSEITKIAFEQLKKGGHAKNFDVLENAPKKQIKSNLKVLNLKFKFLKIKFQKNQKQENQNLCNL
jgi:uncharacterized protein YjdB